MVADLVDMNLQVAVFIDAEGRCKFPAPYKLTVAIREALVDRLAEGFVPSFYENHEFGLQRFQVRSRFAEERAVGIDGMHDGPCQRKQHDAGALQFQQAEITPR